MRDCSAKGSTYEIIVIRHDGAPLLQMTLINLYIINVDGTGCQQLTVDWVDNHSARWVDEQRVVFGADGELHVVNVSTGTIEPFAE